MLVQLLRLGLFFVQNLGSFKLFDGSIIFRFLQLMRQSILRSLGWKLSDLSQSPIVLFNQRLSIYLPEISYTLGCNKTKLQAAACERCGGDFIDYSLVLRICPMIFREYRKVILKQPKSPESPGSDGMSK